MPRFKFRLQKLLELRRIEEAEAKDAYLQAKSARLDAEVEAEKISMRRMEISDQKRTSLDELIAAQAYIHRLEDEEGHMRSALGVLIDEEEGAKKNWVLRKQEAEAFEKLKEKEYEEWQKEEARKEQADLDEWAVQRRAS